MKQDISIVRGTTAAFGIVINDAAGNPFVLEPGQVLVFGLKKRPKDDERVLIKKFTNRVEDQYYLELSAADTADLEPGKYFYDVGLQHGNNVFYNIIEASAFDIKPNITELGDGA